jgi:hypothetical protein
VLRLGDVALPYLLAVQRGGPPSVVFKGFQRGLDDTWKWRQEFLKTPEALDLGPESFAMMKAITRDEYVGGHSVRDIARTANAARSRYPALMASR